MHAMSGISFKNMHIFCIILMLIASGFARPGPAEDRKTKNHKEDDLETSASAYYSYPGSYFYGGYYPYRRSYSYGYPGYYGGFGGYGGYGGYGFGGYYPSYFGFY